MGYASTNPQRTIERLSPGKVLREGNTGYTGNLVAFRQAAGTSEAPQTSTEPRATVQQQNTAGPKVQKPIDDKPKTGIPTQQPPAMPSLGIGHIQPANKTNQQSAASASAVQNSAEPGTIRKSTLALAIIGSLSTGALLGSLWPITTLIPVNTASTLTLTEPTSATAANEPVVTESPLVHVEPALVLAQPTQQVDIERIASVNNPADIQANTVVLAPNTVATLSKEYLVEIDWLIGQNTDLRQEIESLSSETLNLNQELLGLELQIASLEADASPETRTVYNYVNVPIGSDFTSTLQGNNTASTRPETEFNLPVYEEQAVIEAADRLDFDADDQTFSNDEFFAEGEPAFDLDTGFYVDQQYVADVYQYEADAQVAYDPDTGFYVNPNFAVNADQGDFFGVEDDYQQQTVNNFSPSPRESRSLPPAFTQ